MIARRTPVLVLLAAAAAVSAPPETPTWRNLGPGGGGWIQSIAASRHDADEVFVGCDVGGFYRSVDAGAGYTIHNEGLQDYWVESIVPHPTDPRVLFLACLSGVYRSVDRGKSWTWLREGFPPLQRYSWSAPIGALAIDPQHPDTLYAGIGNARREAWGAGMVYRSVNGGETWSAVTRAGQLPADAVITDLAVDPRDGSRLWLACAAGVHQSRDGGETWTRTISGLPHPHVRRLAVSPTQPGTVYCTLRSPPGEAPWRGGVYRSDDGGLTWTARCEGLRTTVGKPGASAYLTANIDRIVVHPTDPETVYAGGATWVNATLYKSTDGGRTWTETIRRGEEGNIDTGWITMWGPAVTCLSISPVNPERLWFGTSGMVYRTDDGGRTWRNAYSRSLPDGRIRGTGLEVTCLHAIVPDPHQAGKWYLGFYDIGLLLAEGLDGTFRRFTSNLSHEMTNSCFAVAFDPRSRDRLWGAFGNWSRNAGTLAASKDGGLSWQEIAVAPEVAPPAARCRSLHVLEQPDAATAGLLAAFDEHGIWRSRDGGATWVPANVGLDAPRVTCLARSAARPGTFWCVAPRRSGDPGGVFRSDDEGTTWQRVAAAAPGADIKTLVAAGPADRLYMGVRDRRLDNQDWPGGVFRSDDGGVTWEMVLQDTFVQPVAVDPRDPDRVYAGLTDHPYHDQSTGRGIVMSRDGGRSWSALNHPSLTCLQVVVIAIDPRDPERLLIATAGNGLFTTRLSEPHP